MPVGPLSLPIGSVLTGQPEVIGSSVLAAAAATVTFQFPSVYRAVQVDAYCKKDATGNTLSALLNNDSASNYTYQYVETSGTTTTAGRSTTTAMYLTNNGVGANVSASFTLLIIKSAEALKGYSILINSVNNGSGVNPILINYAHEWNNTTTLLSRVDIRSDSGNFAANTSMVLWGYRL